MKTFLIAAIAALSFLSVASASDIIPAYVAPVVPAGHETDACGIPPEGKHFEYNATCVAGKEAAYKVLWDAAAAAYKPLADAAEAALATAESTLAVLEAIDPTTLPAGELPRYNTMLADAKAAVATAQLVVDALVAGWLSIDASLFNDFLQSLTDCCEAVDNDE
tara:strand:+ start:1826 stop:2317 length:492 start_codon:yes stop_codon:yes gene_type:complete